MNFTPTRRRFLQTSSAAGAALAAGELASPAAAKPLSFRYAYSAISWETNIEEAIKVGQRIGLPGIEPFRQNVVNYLDKPLALKKLMDDAGIKMVSCSNGGPNFSGNFYDPAKTPKTIADHVKFARDFILPFGYCDHFKMNNGGRPPGYEVSDDQIKICADTLNAIGMETIKFGIKLAPHPHVGSLIQNEHETRKLMELTDPRYVWLTTDTSHLTLGGMDPLQIMKDYWPRVAEVHYKDAPRHLRGNKVVAVPRPPSPESGGHGWFRNLGGDVDHPDSGGVDFPAIQAFLIQKNYKGWVTLDLDASMIPKGSDMEQTLKGNIKYLVDALHVDPRQSNLLVALALLAAPAHAATLTVLAPASAQAGLTPLAAAYTTSTGTQVTVGGGSRAKVVDALKSGPADVVVLPTTDMADLPNVTGMTSLGRITVGVAVKAGAKAPDISTPEKFRAALLAAKGVAYADPSAGTSAGKVIDLMLQAPEFKSVRRVPVKGLAVTALADDRASIALQMLPELAADKDVALAGPVPSAYGAGVDFSAGIAAVSNDATGAEAFISYLTDPKNAALWRKGGLEPLNH